MSSRSERIAALLREAAGALHAGDDRHAARCANEVATLDRRHPALANLEATLALRRGDAPAAKAVLERALRRHPADVWLLTDLAAAERQLGDADAALRLYRRCAALAPDVAATQCNLGAALLAAGRAAEAVPALRRALALEPGLAAAEVHLAQALAAAGRDAEAEPLLRALLERDRSDFGAALALAALLRRSARAAGPAPAQAGPAPAQAGAIDLLESLDAGVRERPDVSFALGNAYTDRDGPRSADALEAYARVLRLDPAHEAARVNLGQSLLRFRRWAEARAAVAPLLAGDAAPADALDVEARACMQLGLAAAARAANLAVARLVDAGALGAATIRRADDPSQPVGVAEHAGNAAVLLQYLEHDPALARDEQRRWAERAFPVSAHAARPRAAYAARAARLAAPAPLRIGYVSGDFRMHSVSYFIGPVLAAQRAGPFEIHCYSNNRRDDARTATLRARAHHWHDVRELDDDALAARIEADAIDVLVDLSGPTLEHRLGVFARRAAPVQVTWLGYPGTTGVEAIDWRLTDALADPEGAPAGACPRAGGGGAGPAGYVERLWRLPGCFCCYEPVEDAPEVAPPPSAANDALTFGSFNAALKLGDATLDLWARVLAAVPRSRLLLKLDGGEHAANREAWLARFEARGVAPERLDIVGWTDTQAPHLARYAEVDLALDTVPYNGVTTTLEALWMGVPVVTLAGTRHAGRTGLSLLAAAGHPEWSARSADEYVAIACRLAADPGGRAALRAALRSQLAASPLFDSAGCARRVEQALLGMWQRARARDDG